MGHVEPDGVVVPGDIVRHSQEVLPVQRPLQDAVSLAVHSPLSVLDVGLWSRRGGGRGTAKGV